MKTKICLLGLLASLVLAFPGCTTPQHGSQGSSCALKCYFPTPPGFLPFNPFRTNLYTAKELLKGYDTNAPDSYYSTPDWQSYVCYQRVRQMNKDGRPDEITARYMRLHELSVEEALDGWLRVTNQAGRRKVVGIMGGHDMERKVFATVTNCNGQVTTSYAPYMQVALLARALATNGFTLLTAGGPGAMEAGNLGAWMAGGSECQLSNAVRMLESVPKSTNSALWLRPAIMVMNQYKNEICHSNNIGVPTWFYGFEPPNPFATHIAKYFENSLREEHLLAISQSGIIFAPGSAGTVQEIFQSACQNYYTNYTANRYPMVLFGTEYWNRGACSVVNEKDKPVWPLLNQLGSEKKFQEQLKISDDIVAIADFIRTYQVNQIEP